MATPRHAQVARRVHCLAHHCDVGAPDPRPFCRKIPVLESHRTYACIVSDLQQVILQLIYNHRAHSPIVTWLWNKLAVAELGRRTSQVAVQPSALAEDGSGAAASVAVSGGNRVRLTDGAALLKDVRLTADAPGTYCIVIASASRRVRSASRLSADAVTTVLAHTLTHLPYLVLYALARITQHYGRQVRTP